ncbi:signal peptidase I [Candidatus Dependentiae bacterium]|nr:signal peptidase I [Candidatus Dependentiae bacterium]
MVTKIRQFFDKKNKSRFRSELEGLIVVIFAAFIIRTVIFGLYQVPTGSMETTLLVGEGFVADKLTYWFRAPKRNEIIAFNDPKYQYSENKFTNLWERYVWGPSNWTKRVIGIPGDHVKGVIENGKPVIYVNNQKIDEPYLNKYPLITLRKSLPTMEDILTGRYYIDQRSYDPNVSYHDQPFYRIDEKLLVKTGDCQLMLLHPGTPLDIDKFDVYLGPDQYWVMGDNRLGSLDSRAWGPLKGHQIHGKIIFRLFSVDSPGSIILDFIKHPIDFWTRIRWSRWLQFVS